MFALLQDSRAAIGRMSDRMPPIGYVIIGTLSVQVGAALSKTVFGLVGPSGVVALRALFGLIVLSMLLRPQWRRYTTAQYRTAAIFGLVTAAMMWSFYQSILRIPLGIAVTLEFVGPLGMSLIGSRKPLDFLWVALAGVGVLLLSPFGSGLTATTLDTGGVILALVGGFFWALYIQFSARTGRAFGDTVGLPVALAFSTMVLLPVGLLDAGPKLFTPDSLVNGLGLALLSLIIPFMAEMEGLKRVPPRIWGIFLALEPAAASIIGLIVLNEKLSLPMVIAIALVSISAYGASQQRAAH